MTARGQIPADSWPAGASLIWRLWFGWQPAALGIAFALTFVFMHRPGPAGVSFWDIFPVTVFVMNLVTLESAGAFAAAIYGLAIGPRHWLFQVSTALVSVMALLVGLYAGACSAWNVYCPELFVDPEMLEPLPENVEIVRDGVSWSGSSFVGGMTGWAEAYVRMAPLEGESAGQLEDRLESDYGTRDFGSEWRPSVMAGVGGGDTVDVEVRIENDRLGCEVD